MRPAPWRIVVAVAAAGAAALLAFEGSLALPRVAATGVVVGVFAHTLLGGRSREADANYCVNCGERVHRAGEDDAAACPRCGWQGSIRVVGRPSMAQVAVLVAAVGVAVAGLPVGLLGGGGVPSLDTGVGASSDDPAATRATAAPPSVTDPPGDNGTSGDSDGDGIPDEHERAGRTPAGFVLEGANPLRKDLYVTVLVGESVEPLTAREIARLESLWAGMPVANPAGEEGIDVHVTQRRVDRELRMHGEREFETLRAELYPSAAPERGACTVRVVALGRVPSQYVGRGSTPGYFVVADGTDTKSYGEAYTQRTVTITHELLHTVVGRFADGSAHTAYGWLHSGEDSEFGDNLFMSDQTARHLSRQGFDGGEGACS